MRFIYLLRLRQVASACLVFFAAAAVYAVQPAFNVARLVPGDPHEGLRFGSSVDIHGDWALIGAINSRDNGVQSGGAYLYRQIGGNWVEETKLIASDGAAQDTMGNAVALSEEVALVGAYQSGASGAAYVYRHDGGSWSETKLTASDSSGFDFFGASTALDADRAVIGAFQHHHGHSLAGSAYVFEYDGIGWNETAELLPSDGSTDFHQRFGDAAAVSGDTIVVGSRYDDDDGMLSGSAYVFQYDGTSWAETAKLLPDDGTEYQQFGGSVAVDGQIAVVGASAVPSFSGTPQFPGAAYVYEFDGLIWNQTARLEASDSTNLDAFGYSVDVDGERIIVGARLSGDLAGAAYLFERDGAGWSETAIVAATDGRSRGQFGISVAMDGNRFISGALFEDDHGVRSGAAYIFAKVPEPSSIALLGISLLLLAVFSGPMSLRAMYL